jgi:aldose sugar dehydrogenase
MHTDGTIPADNPFAGSRVYSYGHRNTQGMCKMPNGNIYLSEHGPTTDDEFQRLIPGANYGWPDVHGFCDTPGEISFCASNTVQEPIAVWTPTIAPSDIVYYSNPAFPEFNGKILMTLLKDERIKALELNATGTALQSETDYLVDTYGRLRDICIGPNQEIYVATNNNAAASLIVIRPPSSVGLAEQGVSGIEVYPTAVTNILTISLGQEVLAPMEIQIVDMAGRVIYEQELNLELTEMDITKLIQGYYWVYIAKNEEPVYRVEIFKGN